MRLKYDKAEMIFALVLAAIFVAMLFAMQSCERARGDGNWIEQGEAELADPAGFYCPSTEIQIGRNSYENIIHGTCYPAPAGEQAWWPMVEYHAQRYAKHIFDWSGQVMDHQLAIDTIISALEIGPDYRLLVIISWLESRCGLGSSNLYGFKCGNSGSPLKQARDCLATIAGYGVGSDPRAVAEIYNPNEPGIDRTPYHDNVVNGFREMDGGDLQ